MMEVEAMARDFTPLQVRFYDDALMEKIRIIAQSENRSMNAQILEFLKQGVEKYKDAPVNNNTLPAK